MGIIYLLENIKNGKQYVGLTERTLDQRWKSHLSKARIGSKLHIHCAIRKYGENSFTRRVLQVVPDKTELGSWEQLYISQLRTTDSAFGYNSTYGGEYGELSEKARHAISERMKGNKCAAGKKWSEERIQNHIKLRTGVSNKGGWTLSEDRKKEISRISSVHANTKEAKERIAKLGRANLGKKHTEEAKRNMGLSHIGSKRREDSKLRMSAARKLWWERKKNLEPFKSL